MTKNASLAVAIVFLVLPVLVRAADDTVLATNYDIKFSIDDQEYRVHSRALVRSGHEIPSVVQDFKVGLRISKTSPEDFLARVVVYERNGSGWYQITTPPPEFTGQLGAPTEYTWEWGKMNVNLAIVVGIYER